jgi:nitrogen regulatory protein PII
MKKFKAYVKPFKLESLLTNLPPAGIHAILASEVRGYGRQKGQLELYSGSEYEWTFLPKARVEIYCDDASAPAVEKALLENARTGRIGDGKVVVQPVEQMESIGTWSTAP